MEEHKIYTNNETIPVLLLENSSLDEVHCRKILGKRFDVWHIQSVSQAKYVLNDMNSKNCSPRVAIIDLIINKSSKEALSLIQSLREAIDKIHVVVWTRYGDELIETAIASGATLAFKKGIDDHTMGDILFDLINKTEACDGEP